MVTLLINVTIGPNNSIAIITSQWSITACKQATGINTTIYSLERDVTNHSATYNTIDMKVPGNGCVYYPATYKAVSEFEEGGGGWGVVSYPDPYFHSSGWNTSPLREKWVW